MLEKPFCDGVKFLLGKGDRIKFWEDLWVIETPLKVRFPRLFNISLDQSSILKDLGLWDGATWVWNLIWSRQLRHWELEQSIALLDLLYNVNLASNRNDRLI